MQLFHIPFKTSWKQIIISDKETVEQCKKVLRLQKDDIINIQRTENNKTTRNIVHINEIKLDIKWEIVQSENRQKSEIKTTMIIAIPNKQEKLELIVQKLTEIWIDEIIFWPAERSIIKTRNTNKEQRLEKIIKEASEQSWNWFLPKISFQEKPENIIQNQSIIIFDKVNWEIKKDRENNIKNISNSNNIIWIIWPEWWLTQKDYNHFINTKQNIISLWESILRIETAAIIWWRYIRNNI